MYDNEPVYPDFQNSQPIQYISTNTKYPVIQQRQPPRSSPQAGYSGGSGNTGSQGRRGAPQGGDGHGILTGDRRMPAHKGSVGNQLEMPMPGSSQSKTSYVGSSIPSEHPRKPGMTGSGNAHRGDVGLGDSAVRSVLPASQMPGPTSTLKQNLGNSQPPNQNMSKTIPWLEHLTNSPDKGTKKQFLR